MSRLHCLKKDDISWARLSRTVPAFAARRRKPRGRRGAGIRYERRALDYFLNRFEHRYIPSPWITFALKSNGGLNWAQPDALLVDIDAGLITLIEMKYQHTPEAYWQLMTKYLPLVQRIFGTKMWKYATVEVVKWYDCQVAFPIDVTLRDCITRVRPGEFGVHIWKP